MDALTGSRLDGRGTAHIITRAIGRVSALVANDRTRLRGALQPVRKSEPGRYAVEKRGITHAAGGGGSESLFQDRLEVLTPSTHPGNPSRWDRRRPQRFRRSTPRAKTSQHLPTGSIPAHARGSGQRHRLGRRCHRMPNPFRGPLGWRTRRRLGCAVVSEWSVEPAKPRQPRHRWRALPQVRALRVHQDRTPKAGVGGSHRSRRIED